MKGFPDLPPVWWAASIALIYVAKWSVPELHFTVSGGQFVSRAVLLVAILIFAWSVIWFRRKRTPIEPHHRPKALIIEGPYRLTRNPIYLAMVLLTVSAAIGHGSPFGILCAIALWWILDRRFVRPEEAGLLAIFGEEAETYMRKTRRWL